VHRIDHDVQLALTDRVGVDVLEHAVHVDAVRGFIP